jgi:hypothetical protein
MSTKTPKPQSAVRKRHNYLTSTTSPDDPEAIPAFETSAGIAPRSAATKPVIVNKTALENFVKGVDPVLQKHQLEAANVAALFAKRAIRPDEIAALRRRMFEVVGDGLEDVAQVIAGKKQWSPVQVRLFSLLTERVMPKLATITTEDKSAKKIEELSMEELEALALGKKNHEAIDAVVKQGKELDAEAERTENASANRKLKKITHTIASIDEAEDVVSKRLSRKEVAPVLKKASRGGPLPSTSARTLPKGWVEVGRSVISGESKASQKKRLKPSTRPGST